jgi:uncharacterized membrane protein (DUF373 family)
MQKWKHANEQWAILSYYQRFESVIAIILTALIGLIILAALYRLTVDVVAGLIWGLLDPFDPKVFQVVFGEILTVLIAMEFNHTLQYVVTREQTVIQTKVVMLIALLALARKFIVLDVHELSPGQLIGLAAITLGLGITYWLMRERDDRMAARSQAPPSM